MYFSGLTDWIKIWEAFFKFTEFPCNSTINIQVICQLSKDAKNSTQVDNISSV